MNLWLRNIGLLLSTAVLVGCTSTSVVMTDSKKTSQKIALAKSNTAVLSFSGAPDSPETARISREVALGILVEKYEVNLISPSKVNNYEKEHSFIPSEYDTDALDSLAIKLGANLVVWGSVNQYTPYKFDRAMPATPPYAEITMWVFNDASKSIVKVNGRKQGKIPATIWSRQPTFEDIAKPLLSELFAKL